MQSRFSAVCCIAVISVLLLPALTSAYNDGDKAKLLLTEIVVRPKDGQYIEIHNPDDFAVDLSNYYLSNSWYLQKPDYFYYLVVTGYPGTIDPDYHFNAKFPDGAVLPAKGTIWVSVRGSSGFLSEWGSLPDFEVYEDDATPDAVPNMEEATPGSIVDGEAELSTTRSSVVLYYWDGESDLVEDSDYCVWGTSNSYRVDKSEQGADGPDPGPGESPYLDDTHPSSQEPVSSSAHSTGKSFTRVDLAEGTQTALGNGITGEDETSERLASTWTTDLAPSPPDTAGCEPLLGKKLLLAEVVTRPWEGEYIKVWNPSETDTIDLTYFHLTDATDSLAGLYYYNIVCCDSAGGGTNGDFHVKFPFGALLGPGDSLVVSMAGSRAFRDTYRNALPTYELYEDDPTEVEDRVPEMREAFTGAVGYPDNVPELEANECVILYFWDECSDLIQDVDYLIWGDWSCAVNKTGISRDGADGDSTASTYLHDTPIPVQYLASETEPVEGHSLARLDALEGAQTPSGGNGVTGADETSENSSNTWGTAEVSPPPARPKLLISEVVITPSAGEYIEIYNPNDYAVDLSDVYLTDAIDTRSDYEFYYDCIVKQIYPETTGGPCGGAGGGTGFDFHARFPEGALLEPNSYASVAIQGSQAYVSQYGVQPTLELYEDGLVEDDIPDMRESHPGSINYPDNAPNLSSDEIAILYYWNRWSDLVSDLDYVLWGEFRYGAWDKTGRRFDGPDVDKIESTYLPDTDTNRQQAVASEPHRQGFSYSRVDFTEGAQDTAGGNGVLGSDETSENVNETFTPDLPVSPPPSPHGPVESPRLQVAANTILVPQSTFIPRLQERMPITFAAPDGSYAHLRILDLYGRLVRVLYNSGFAGEMTIYWDGRDETYERVTAGTYICHLHVTTSDGSVVVKTAPIVVAVRLE